MKKYVVGLAIASAFSLVAVSLFVYFVIQTIALAFFVDPLTTSFPWYGYCPTMLFLALIAVPMILVGEKYLNTELRSGGKLADLIPTLLQVMGLPQPEEMSGQSLIVG